MPGATKNAKAYRETDFFCFRISPPALISVIVCLCFSAGCQVVNKLEVSASRDELFFKSSEIDSGLTRDILYVLIDISVIEKDCETDCLKWALVRKDAKEYLTPSDDNLFPGRITYGQHQPGMDERERAQQLTPGVYTVSATVEVFESDRNPIKSMLLYRKFRVQRRGTSDLKIDYVD